MNDIKYLFGVWIYLIMANAKIPRARQDNQGGHLSRSVSLLGLHTTVKSNPNVTTATPTPRNNLGNTNMFHLDLLLVSKILHGPPVFVFMGASLYSGRDSQSLSCFVSVPSFFYHMTRFCHGMILFLPHL